MSYKSTKWPENGSGMILNEQESYELINNINKKENELLTDLWDIADTTFIPSNVLVTTNIIWEHIVDINGETIPNEEYEKLIGDKPGIIICSKKKMLPLQAAYNSIDELINEMKSVAGEYLPDNFDYAKHLIIYDLVFEE